MTQKEPMPLAFSYVRMSTDTQVRGDSLRRQKQASAEYCEKNGLQLVEGTELTDIGISAYKGRNVEGGALGVFLETVRQGKVPEGSYLIVESLDRLSRQAINKSQALFLDLINSGVKIVTLADNRVYEAGKKEIFFDLIYSLGILTRANEESEIKSYRIAQAWEQKRKLAHSKPLTRKCPAWLEMSQDRKSYTVRQERAKIVQRIFSESASGIGNYTITRRLNQSSVKPFSEKSRGWQKSSVAKILKNRAAIGAFQPHKMFNGKRVPAGEEVPHYFPPIIDEQTFYKVQSGLDRRKASGGRKGDYRSNLFSGRVFCFYCDSRMRYENKGILPKGGRYLVCDGALRGLGCCTTRWKYDDFEVSFLSFVTELNLSDIIDRRPDEDHRTKLDEISELKGRRDSVEARLRKLDEVLLEADIGYLKTQYQQYEFELNRLNQLIQLLEGEHHALKSEQAERDSAKLVMRDLLLRLDKKNTAETYTLRSEIAQKLSALEVVVSLAPDGEIPMITQEIERIQGKQYRNQEDLRLLKECQQHLLVPVTQMRFFNIGFGQSEQSIRVVYPDEKDPSKFHFQLMIDQKTRTFRHLTPSHKGSQKYA